MPSNTWRFLAAVAVAFAVMGSGAALAKTEQHQSVGQTLFLIGFSFPFLGTVLAQLSTGYTWKNLAPGNRGVSRAEEPRRFWVSAAGNVALSVAIIGLALWNLLK